jgi:hypothetical protein
VTPYPDLLSCSSSSSLLSTRGKSVNKEHPSLTPIYSKDSHIVVTVPSSKTLKDIKCGL